MYPGLMVAYVVKAAVSVSSAADLSGVSRRILWMRMGTSLMVEGALGAASRGGAVDGN